MYCLSNICCICLRSNVQLKFLNEPTQFTASQTDTIKNLIGESLFSELGHVLSICEGCTRQVKNVDSFWQISRKNNKILTEYLRELRLLGSDFGRIQIRMDDITRSTDPEILTHRDKFGTNGNIHAAENIAADAGSGMKSGDQECARELSENEGDTTTYETIEENCRYDIQTDMDEAKFFKIEIHDDFEEMHSHVKRESNEIGAEFPEKSIRDDEERPIPDNSGENCSRNIILIRHTPTSAGEKKHGCETCGKSFSVERLLARHTLTHTGERRHRCETCGKRFAQRPHLTRHMLTHTGEKPHKCEHCGKSFALKNTLTSHALTHTGEKRHECPCCGKSFARAAALNVHMVSHTGEKPYPCETCGKSYADRFSLAGHTLSHTGERPHGCGTCGKSFAKKSSLTNHLLLHAGERPHGCGSCGKSFVRRCDLTAHAFLHTGEKPHECGTCGKRFSRRSNLTVHMSSHV